MSFSWFDRAPSPSNIADTPSRGGAPPNLLLDLKSHVCKRVEIPVGIQETWVVEWKGYADLV